MRIVCSYYNTGIKITSFATAKQFLEEVLVPNNEYHIMIEPDYSLHIYTNRGDKTIVTQRFGSHKSIFTPEVVIYGDDILRALYHGRKAINDYFFNDER